MKLFIVLLYTVCMLYTKTSFPDICVAISGDRLIFGVITVLFVK